MEQIVNGAILSGSHVEKRRPIGFEDRSKPNWTALQEKDVPEGQYQALHLEFEMASSEKHLEGLKEL
ncbi:MAG TPA: hypothetical protein VEF34_21180 [Syntrophobacteraceae bacterium]|nr:hypothetical protein [Syntrophobacteraceae bacterium]